MLAARRKWLFSLYTLCNLFWSRSQEDLISIQSNKAEVCFSHSTCSQDSFCAWHTCQDELGTNFSCGLCEPCALCVCNSDSIDLTCPLSHCPSQPSGQVRFLQGIFYNRSNMSGFPTYNCVRRFVISGSIFSFLQIIVHSSHPASITNINVSLSAAVSCPTVSLSGVINSSTAAADGTLDLDVAVTSEGKISKQTLSLPSGSNLR